MCWMVERYVRIRELNSLSPKNDCQHEISGKVDVHDLVPRLKQTHVFES